jgi:hypothetical protein
VQLDPIKPKLKPPGTKRLKLKCDILLSTSAFNLNVRRYKQEEVKAKKMRDGDTPLASMDRMKAVQVGAHTRPHFSST